MCSMFFSGGAVHPNQRVTYFSGPRPALALHFGNFRRPARSALCIISGILRWWLFRISRRIFFVINGLEEIQGSRTSRLSQLSGQHKPLSGRPPPRARQPPRGGRRKGVEGGRQCHRSALARGSMVGKACFARFVARCAFIALDASSVPMTPSAASVACCAKWNSRPTALLCCSWSASNFTVTAARDRKVDGTGTNDIGPTTPRRHPSSAARAL